MMVLHGSLASRQQPQDSRQAMQHLKCLLSIFVVVEFRVQQALCCIESGPLFIES